VDEMNERRGNGLLFVLLGCAGFSLLALCGATGVAAFLVMRDGEPPFAADADSAPGDPAVTLPPRGGSAPSAPALPRVRISATVASASGSAVPNGAECLFDVEPPPDARSMCRAQVVCGGQLVYGGQNAGYFPCSVAPGNPPSIAGREDDTTSADGDAAMAIDTAARTLAVRDDARGPHGAFTIVARIDAVQ
jgi:hypothetical protein